MQSNPIKRLSDKEVEETIRAYEAAGSAVGAARILGIKDSTMRNRIMRLRRSGRISDKASPKQNTTKSNLADELLLARPRIWWDALSETEQADLLKIKENHLAGKHRISIKEIHDRCRRHYQRISVSREKFGRWLTDDKTREPQE